LAILSASCGAPRPVRKEEAPPVRARPAVRIDDLEKQIHALINRERTQQGLSPLTGNEELTRIARKHSQDMAKRNYFSHQSPEGRGFSWRYAQGGYSCGVTAGDRIYMGAENIFQNNLYDRVVYLNGVPRYDWNSARKIAETTVQGWMNSPGHRKNILTPHWRSEGIGVAISPDDKIYITQNFC